MSQVLSRLLYLDDVIVYAENYMTLLDNLQQVFLRLRHFRLTVHLAKCEFSRSDLIYLGHHVTERHNEASEAHVKAILDYPSPNSKKQLQTFLGTCNWFREFVPHAAIVLDPLYAAATRLGATLYQMDGERKLIMGNISTSLNSTERSYSSNEKELFAIIWACKKFRPYLKAKQFILRTDNRALLWLQQFKDERSKLTRWALFLQELDFTIEHFPGRLNLLPNALSRQPLADETKDEIESITFPITELPHNLDDPGIVSMLNINQPLLIQVKRAQDNDPVTQEHIARYLQLLETLPGDINKADIAFLQKYQVLGNHLYYSLNNFDGWMLYVPESMRKEVIQHYHTDELYRHRDFKATQVLISTTYLWPNLQQDIALFIRGCEICARTKVAGRVGKAPLKGRRNSINQATQVAPSQVYFNQLLRHPDEVEDSRSSMDPAETESFFTYHKKAIHNQEKYVKKYEGESFQKLHPVGPIYLREKDPRESTLDMGIAQFERDLLSLIGTLSKLGTKKLILVPPPSIVGRSNHRKAFENARRKVEDMKKKNRHILLFMDNCTVHNNAPILSNITIHFFPPNTTSKLQPLDQGIIHNFKTFYRKEVVKIVLDALDKEEPVNISVLSAMLLTDKAWRAVTSNTILNCFKKAGFPFDSQTEDQLEDIAPTHDFHIPTDLDVDMDEFIRVDDEVAVWGPLTDDEIVEQTAEPTNDQTIDNPDGGADDDSEVVEPVSIKEARAAFGKLKMFCLQCNDVDDQDFQALFLLEARIDNEQNAALKQTKITDFFKKSTT
ncbi:hypothetical protein WDU94_001815 [Cyamophila willieti]